MNFITIGIVSPEKVPLRSTHHVPPIAVGGLFCLFST